MSGLFKDPSLEVTIDVVVTRTVIFETDQVPPPYCKLYKTDIYTKDDNTIIEQYVMLLSNKVLY